MDNETGKGLRYLSIARGMRQKVDRREWLPGEQIPPVRDLARTFDTSIKTINRALEELGKQGLLERVQGRDIFLRPRDQWVLEDEGLPYLCLTPGGGNPVNQSLVTALGQEVARAGGDLHVQLHHLSETGALPRILTPFRGILAVDFAPPGSLFSLLNELSARYPLIYLGGFAPPPDYAGSYLAWDMEGGLEEAVQTLMNRGHERIGYLGGGLPLDRDPGFLTLRRVMQFHDLKVSRRYDAVPAGFDFPAGHRAMKELLAPPRGDDFPSAFISLYDGVAAGAMAAPAEAGLEIPGDAAFISCENSDLARSLKPGLTALSLERESAAALAGKLLELLEQGRAGKRSPLGIKIPLTLEERGTTGEEEGDFSHRWL